jgi:hypothetical protein
MMTFPKVNQSDPRNWVAPDSYGKLAGPDCYEGRGAMPDVPVPTPPPYKFVPPVQPTIRFIGRINYTAWEPPKPMVKPVVMKRKTYTSTKVLTHG